MTVTWADGSFDLPWDGDPLGVVEDAGVVEIYGRLGIAAVPIPVPVPAPALTE